MNISQIIIVEGTGPDKVNLITDLPDATFPYKQTLAISFTAAQGTGKDYVKKHWPGVWTTVISKS